MRNKGFTLIEILVVVLIIGILAAVALPKYLSAVEKARATEVLNILHNMATAEKSYFLANGEYTTNISDLDIEFPYDYDVITNMQGRDFFYGKDFTYVFWYDKTGLLAQREYKDGLYLLQIDFNTNVINCAGDNKTQEICFMLGFTRYYTTQTGTSAKTNRRHSLNYYYAED